MVSAFAFGMNVCPLISTQLYLQTSPPSFLIKPSAACRAEALKPAAANERYLMCTSLLHYLLLTVQKYFYPSVIYLNENIDILKVQVNEPLPKLDLFPQSHTQTDRETERQIDI